MQTAVIDARYSSYGQTEQSIEGQIRECTDYAKQNDIVIVDTYIDRAMTGTNDNRFNFQRMMKDATKQAWDLVLVYKLDRFSRNKYEMAIHRKTLKDNKIRLVSVKESIPDTPEGVILESMLEGMAEYYSLELAQKVRRGQKESRIKGNYAGGGVPYGYRIEKIGDSKKYVICEEEAAVVLRIFEEYASGKIGREIMDGLKADGIRNRARKPIGRTMLYGILQNERYAGIYRHKTDGVFYDTFPRIVPQEIFEVVQKIAISNKHGGVGIDEPYLLRGKARCGICGKKIYGDSDTSRNGTVHKYYTCQGRKQIKSKCSLPSTPKKILEDIVADITRTVLDDSKNIDKLVDKILELNKLRAETDSVLSLLNKEMAQIESSIANLLKALEQGIVTQSTKSRLEELEAQRTELEQKIAVRNANARIKLSKQEITKFIAKAMRKEAALMIRMLIKEVVIYNDKIEIYYRYTDSKRPDEEDAHQVFCFYETTEMRTHVQNRYDVLNLVMSQPNEVELKWSVKLYI